MKKSESVLSFRNVMVVLALAGMTAFVTGCVAPFSDLQSARLLGKGNIEVTPSYTSVSASDEGETQHVQNHYGAQVGFGLARFMDFRLRFEHISASIEEDSVSANVLGFGPKFRLAKNWLAFYVPIGFAFGGDVENGGDSWQVHPTLLATFPVAKFLEINPSAKVMIPFKSDAGDTAFAFNLGLAISSDVTKWAIRPEVGICTSTSFEGGIFMQFSIGVSLGSGLFKK
jgi:hypothetical protein